MLHIDEKFKDNSPVKTVEHIRRLLQDRKIDIAEQWNESGIENCYSVRVSVADSTMFSYGKGVTKELARASGYAELMERLQSGYLCPGKITYSDAKEMTRTELLEQSGVYLQKMAENVAAAEHKPFSADKLLDNAFSYGDRSTTDAIPFYNANDGSKVYLPETMISKLYSSNGLAAGNSCEEALVQGFSEVVERYCHCRIIRERIVPPTVPKTYLAQFPTAYSIISAMEEKGYTVIIKDCSLGEGYPVVASAVIDPKRHGYRVNVGSSPVFEIALERCLTEIMQGRNINTLPMYAAFTSKNSQATEEIMYALVAGNGAYPIDFFEGEPSYPFVPFPDRSNATNKDLLRYITEYLTQHDRTMLIRDLSHYGFHTYRIIVPGISEVFGFAYTGEPSLLRMGYELRDVIRNPQKASREQLEIYSILYQTTPRGSRNPLTFTSHAHLPIKLSLQEDIYYGIIAEAFVEWKLGNYPKSYRLVQSARSYAPEDKKELIESLCTYIYLLFAGYRSEEIIQKLRLFYDNQRIVSLSALVSDNANPFETLFPVCDENCEDCPWADRCAKGEQDAVREKLNAAAAEFDAEKSFEELERTFADARRK